MKEGQVNTDQIEDIYVILEQLLERNNELFVQTGGFGFGELVISESSEKMVNEGTLITC